MKLKPVSAIKVIKALERIGFKAVRQSGSHVILKHNDGRMTVVPVHSGELIGRGLLRRIINEISLEKEEFLRFLEEV